MLWFNLIIVELKHCDIPVFEILNLEGLSLVTKSDVPWKGHDKVICT